MFKVTGIDNTQFLTAVNKARLEGETLTVLQSNVENDQADQISATILSIDNASVEIKINGASSDDGDYRLDDIVRLEMRVHDGSFTSALVDVREEISRPLAITLRPIEQGGAGIALKRLRNEGSCSDWSQVEFPGTKFSDSAPTDLPNQGQDSIQLQPAPVETSAIAEAHTIQTVSEDAQVADESRLGQGMNRSVVSADELLGILLDGGKLRCTIEVVTVIGDQRIVPRELARDLIESGLAVLSPYDPSEEYQAGAVYEISGDALDPATLAQIREAISVASTSKEVIRGSEVTWDHRGQDYINRLLLACACHRSLSEVTKALGMGADPNFTDEKGWRPLLKAVSYCPPTYDIVKELIAAGAELRYQFEGAQVDVLRHAVSRCAAFGNHTTDAEPLIDLLVSAGAQVSLKGNHVLFATIDRYDGTISVSSVRALLKHGADPSVVALMSYYRENDDIPQNVLSYYTYLCNKENFQQFFDAIRLVVENGGQIDPHKLDVPLYCCSALAAAVYQGNVELTEYFLENGANTSIRINGIPLIESMRSRAADDSTGRVNQCIHLVSQSVSGESRKDDPSL
jgi:hypothetical protein